MPFQSLILAHPDLTQRQWAAWLRKSEGAIYHYAQGQSSPPVDDCAIAFPSFPPSVQDAFLAMFPRLIILGDEDALSLSIRAAHLSQDFVGRMLAWWRDPFSTADSLAAIALEQRRVLEAAVAAAVKLGSRRPDLRRRGT